LADALDGRHRGAFGLHGEDRAGLHGTAIQVDGAGAALGGVAAHMGAGELKLLADELDQQHAGVDGGRYRLAVDGHRNGHGHETLLLRFFPVVIMLGFSACGSPQGKVRGLVIAAVQHPPGRRRADLRRPARPGWT
jgi:hypothetical protein